MISGDLIRKKGHWGTDQDQRGSCNVWKNGDVSTQGNRSKHNYWAIKTIKESRKHKTHLQENAMRRKSSIKMNKMEPL